MIFEFGCNEAVRCKVEIRIVYQEPKKFRLHKLRSGSNLRGDLDIFPLELNFNRDKQR